MSKKWVKKGEAEKIIGVHPRTLYVWENKGLIETKRTEGWMILFNIEKYINDIKYENNEESINELNKLEKTKEKLNIK